MTTAILTDNENGTRIYCDNPAALWETVASVEDCTVLASDRTADELLAEPDDDHGDYADRPD